MTDDWLRWSWGCGARTRAPQRRVGGARAFRRMWLRTVASVMHRRAGRRGRRLWTRGCRGLQPSELSALDIHEAAVEVGEQLVQVEPVGAAGGAGEQLPR